MEQVGLALTGAVAIYLSQQKDETLKRYACIFGLLGQPFWFYATYQAGQWGIFALSFIYTYSWAVGFRNNWLK